MTSSRRFGAGRRRPVRMWWALPTLTVVGAAIGMGVVVGPTLGEHVSIPHQLLLPATASTSARESQTATAPKPHTPRASPKPASGRTASPAPTSTPVQATHVVAPRRPVVTASSEDSRERESSTHDVGTGDR